MNRTFTILMPVYNDWEAVTKLLRLLNDKLSEAGHLSELLLINDGSTVPCVPANLAIEELGNFPSAEMITLGTNVGHQRAIAIGIAYLASREPSHDVVIMDSDGEDKPADVPRLIAAADSEPAPRIILALRSKRSESAVFRLGYAAYTLLFRLLTGSGIRFGNFSFIPAEFLTRLARTPELWNNFAATVIKSRLPRTSISTARGSRLGGASTMNFVALVLHGLGAISVFNDVVAVRLLCVSLAFAFACGVLIFGIIMIRVFTMWAIPGWATVAIGIATLLFTNALLFAVTFVFFTLSNRTTNVFVPARDYEAFVQDVVTLKHLAV
jgi:glycosyltransferase involved in cell wall biosynthesis